MYIYGEDPFVELRGPREKKDGRTPCIFLAGTETYCMTHMTTYSDHVSRKAMALHNIHVKKKSKYLYVAQAKYLHTSNMICIFGSLEFDLRTSL